MGSKAIVDTWARHARDMGCGNCGEQSFARPAPDARHLVGEKVEVIYRIESV